MEKNFPNGDGILQHEYAPCYTSKKVKKVIEELKIKYDSVLWELPWFKPHWELGENGLFEQRTVNS